jgi:hypothetical protein
MRSERRIWLFASEYQSFFSPIIYSPAFFALVDNKGTLLKFVFVFSLCVVVVGCLVLLQKRMGRLLVFGFRLAFGCGAGSGRSAASRKPKTIELLKLHGEFWVCVGFAGALADETWRENETPSEL